MAEHAQLLHPPLREAVIDFRISDRFSEDAFAPSVRKTLDGFGEPVRMFSQFVSFPLTAPPSSGFENVSRVHGLRYTSADGSRIVQMRIDGFTFSIIRGYSTWPEAKASARSVWEKYCEWWNPTAVVRSAVRYINVLSVPAGEDLDLYLAAGPRIPSGLPGRLSGFLHRVAVPLSPEGTTAVVTQALEQVQEFSVSVVLDIDVWREFSYPVGSTDLWALLDTLREIKNRIFFSSVTEKALESYK